MRKKKETRTGRLPPLFRVLERPPFSGSQDLWTGFSVFMFIGKAHNANAINLGRKMVGGERERGHLSLCVRSRAHTPPVPLFVFFFSFFILPALRVYTRTWADEVSSRRQNDSLRIPTALEKRQCQPGGWRREKGVSGFLGVETRAETKRGR